MKKVTVLNNISDIERALRLGVNKKKFSLKDHLIYSLNGYLLLSLTGKNV
jgi:hypothetical protein